MQSALTALLCVPAAASTPQVARAVFNPRYETTYGVVSAGKAFVATSKACGPLIVSAYHLFGPSGGLKQLLSPAELRSSVKRISLRNIYSDRSVFPFKASSITPADATACCESGKPVTGVGDIAVFRAPAALAPLALTLAYKPVNGGEHVRVVTSLLGVSAKTQSFEAVVLGMRNGYLIYDFMTPGFTIRATSGAPVLDADGQVVAIHLGGGSRGDGQTMYGIGNPTSAWINAVERACK